MPELLNSCLLLYAWRVGFNYKMIHNLSSTVISSSTALEDLDRMIASNDGQQVSVLDSRLDACGRGPDCWWCGQQYLACLFVLPWFRQGCGMTCQGVKSRCCN